MSIGKRLREARKEAGLSQVELGKKVGLSQGTISELENGESASTGSTASLAAVLGVNSLWLESGKGPKRATNEQVRSTSAPTYQVPHEELARMIAAYSALPPAIRQEVLEFAQVSAARAAKEIEG